MITEKLHKIKDILPDHVTLVAVSKTKPNAAIEEAYNSGQRVFGENRVQELVDKYESLPKDIEWHMIGHLQRNKVKYIAPFISLIHGIDTPKLLKEVNKEAQKNGRIIDCLIQIHIAEEESKHGFSIEEAKALFEDLDSLNLKNIRLRGLMGMATFTDDTEKVANEFSSLKSCFDDLKPNQGSHFDTISMGMSGDYPIAIEKGSTMVRIGSSIFGSR